MEVVRFEAPDRAEGTQVGVAYELRWRLEGAQLDLDVVEGPRTRVDLGACDFFDLAYSAYFNSLPVWRDDLLRTGERRDYVMRFVSVPELSTFESRQRYEPVGPRTIRYSSGSFAADIDFDDEGFVTLYHDFLERVG